MKSLSFTILLTLTLCGLGFGAAPNLVSYQGRLTDPSGNAVANSTYAVTFAIYAVPTGGSPLWLEVQPVPTTNGLFSTLLGGTTPFTPNLFADSVRYLGIKVGVDPELSPRTRLASVPFALAPASGWSDDGAAVHLVTTTDKVGIGTASPTRPLHVVEPSGGFFVSRFEASSPIATVTEYSNTSSAATWEVGVTGSSGAFSGAAQAQDMYINMQGSSFPAAIIKPNGSVGFGTGSPLGQIHAATTGATAGYFESSGATNITDGVVHAEYKGAVPGQPTAFYGKSAPVDGQGIGAWLEGGSTGAYCIVNQTGSGSYKGLSSSATTSGTGTTYGLYSQGLGAGTNFGIYAAASGAGATNYAVYGYVPNDNSSSIAGYFSKGFGLSMTSLSNPVAVFQNSSNSYISVNSPNNSERGILFGQPSQEAAGGIVYNTASVPNGLSFRTSNNTTKMVVTSSGDVGVGTSSPTAKLHVVGNICYTGSIGACSDIRYKTAVSTLSGSLDKLLQLRGVSYRWKKDEFPNQNFDDRAHIGFIAQEVEQLYPEMVMTDSAGYKSVDYGRLTPVLVEAIKEQQKTIDSMAEKLQTLEEKITQLVNANSGGSTQLSQK